MTVHQAVLTDSCPSAEPMGGARLSGCIPLSLAEAGKAVTVQGVRGKDETRRFLESLGFVENAAVTVITELSGNVIVNVKDTRVAISKAMAARIYTN